MATAVIRAAIATLVMSAPSFAQTASDPFPRPIPASEGVIRVNVVEFASLPDIGGEPARMMLLVDEPGTRRLFVNDMRGPLYTRQLRRQDASRCISTSTPRTGASASSRWAASAGSRALRSTRSSTRPARRGFGKFYT